MAAWPPTTHQDVQDAVGALQNLTGTAQTFPVDDYGADPTGVADSTAAFTQAVSAAQAALASGSIYAADIVVGTGRYKVTGGQVAITDTRASIRGAGSRSSLILGQGSGDILTISNPAWSSNPGSGPWSESDYRASGVVGLAIDGTGCGTATAAGIHHRDRNNTRFDDVLVQHFTGVNSVGIWMHKDLGWSERSLWLGVTVRDCTAGVCFDGKDAGGGSFDYSRILDLRLSIYPGQTGVLMRNFAQLDQVVLNVTFNSYATGGTASTVLVVGPTDDAAERSRIINSNVVLQGEKEGSSSEAYDMHIGQWATFTGSGTLDFMNGYTSGGVNSGEVYFTGYIICPSLSKTSFDTGHGFKYGTALYNNPVKVMDLIWTDTRASGATAVTIKSGAGAPTNVWADPGDWYIRTDTPTTAGQRLYVNTGATKGTNTWTGIA